MQYIIIMLICHQYVEANNTYVKNYDKNKESSYIKY